MDLKVGYIGLGDMGKPIAINQAKNHFDLMVFDKRAEPLDELRALGARIARSPREVAEHADIVGLSLRDDAQVESVVLGPDGILSGARPGAVITVHTTCHPDTIRKLAEHAKPKGVGVLDAPVSKGSVGAARAALCFMVGGDKALFDKCRPIFEASGSEIFHVGDLGSGSIAKLAHQVIVVGTLSAVAEGMLLAKTAGVDLQAFDQVVRHGAAQSYFADAWLDRVKDMRPEVIAVMSESVDPALKLGRELGISMLLTGLGQQLLPLRVPENGSRTLAPATLASSGHS